MKTKRISIVMAEDNEHDIVAVRRIWRLNNLEPTLTIVHDGEECLNYLFHRGKFRDMNAETKPDLLLLDIKMPRLDGFAVLEHIRKSTTLYDLPVIVITTSRDPADRDRCYVLGANAVLLKPINFKEYSDALVTLVHFWNHVAYPRRSA